MEISEGDVWGLIFVLLGVVTSKIAFEYGRTEANSRANFISPKKSMLHGDNAGLAGFLMIIVDGAVVRYSRVGEVLFAL